jgi:Uma2 family endonuclease
MEIFDESPYDAHYADTRDETAEPVIEKNTASRNHAKIQSRLAKDLGNNYDENYDIYTEFEIELLGKKVIPDVSILPIQPSDWKNDLIRGQEAPILVIEILSPKQAFNDITDKIYNIYFPAGVSSAWVVLPPTESVMVFTPNDDIKTIRRGIVKDDTSGFEVDFSKIFR